MDNTKTIQNATPIDDISGLKLSNIHTMQDIYLAEAKNIAKATIKYLSATPTKKLAPFTYEWFLSLHKEMFEDVWKWAGKLRTVELSIGIKAYLVSGELKKLVDDLDYWNKHQTYDIYEIASRLHHKAVFIHPFKNGNGRWSRMLTNIYLRTNNLMPVKWQEDLLAKENPNRSNYIQALKSADGGDFELLIGLHKNTY